MFFPFNSRRNAFVDDTVKTCITIGIISKRSYHDLTGSCKTITVISDYPLAIDDFKEIDTYQDRDPLVQNHRLPVIKLSHMIHIFEIGTLNAGLIHFAHHSVGSDIFDGFKLPDCRYTQCI